MKEETIWRIFTLMGLNYNLTDFFNFWSAGCKQSLNSTVSSDSNFYLSRAQICEGSGGKFWVRESTLSSSCRGSASRPRWESKFGLRSTKHTWIWYRTLIEVTRSWTWAKVRLRSSSRCLCSKRSTILNYKIDDCLALIYCPLCSMSREGTISAFSRLQVSDCRV